jgi:hypothetical protein
MDFGVSSLFRKKRVAGIFFRRDHDGIAANRINSHDGAGFDFLTV